MKRVRNILLTSIKQPNWQPESTESTCHLVRIKHQRMVSISCSQNEAAVLGKRNLGTHHVHVSE